MDNGASFFSLDPENVMQATEAAGFVPTGEFAQLNSYENRVFNIVLEPANAHENGKTGGLVNSREQIREQIIAKFYRPGRWLREAILEEHEFLFELKADQLAAVSPLILRNGESL